MIGRAQKVILKGEERRSGLLTQYTWWLWWQRVPNHQVTGVVGETAVKEHLDWDSLDLRIQWDNESGAWRNTWHTERDQLSEGITMITVCQAHLPWVLSASGTGSSSSFFSCWSEQVRMAIIWATIGGNRWLHRIQGWTISWTQWILLTNYSNGKTFDQGGMFFFGIPGR